MKTARQGSELENMNKISTWGKAATFLTLVFTVAGGFQASTSMAHTARHTHRNTTPSSNQRLSAQSQNFQGECRATNRSIFVYREPRDSTPITVLDPNQSVILAGNIIDDTWIAINSPTLGFVETRYLKTCSSRGKGGEQGAPTSTSDSFVFPPSNDFAFPAQTSPPANSFSFPQSNFPIPAQTFPPTNSFSFPGQSVSFPPNQPQSAIGNFNSCRQVTYEGREGVIIRQQPTRSAPRQGKVYLGDRINLANMQPFMDSTGREWVSINSPYPGWISNGFPANGDINLGICR